MPMTEYKRKRDACRVKVLDKYEIIGFISSGTYGRVYKARSRDRYGCLKNLGNLVIASTHRLCSNDPREFAIKKFKPDREGDSHHYVGISQSACREIAVS